jgi:hypothetical protein
MVAEHTPNEVAKNACNSLTDAAWKMFLFSFQMIVYFYVGFCMTSKKYWDFKVASELWESGSSGKEASWKTWMRWIYFKQAVKSLFKDPRLLYATNIDANNCKEFWKQVKDRKGNTFTD